MSEADQGELNDLISQYETNLLALRARCDQPEVLSAYRELVPRSGREFPARADRHGEGAPHGRPVGHRTATMVGTYPSQALEKMKLVEDRSLGVIQDSTAANSRSAEFRLLIVLAALIGVVGAVTIMGFVILRGVRNTVNEVSQAARSLAIGRHQRARCR
jgi:hypothetical protein